MPSTLSTRLRRALPRPRLTRRRLITLAVVLAVVVGVVGWAAWPTPKSYLIENQTITVETGPDGTTPVALDTTYYQPKVASKAHPVAAVLLAHGFGGTKDDVADDAKDLADHGYAVLAWTAEGFGSSGGQIHLDSPDWEVRDAQRLIDWLAARPAEPPRPNSLCCENRAQPRSSTRSPRRPCSCRARRTRCSHCPRRTPMRGASPRTVPPSGWPGSPAATTAAPARSPTRTGCAS